jgi:KUP system potassium uptake protein
LIENRATTAAEAARQAPQGRLQTLGLSALGIVFGDIGTSPLYTFKTILGTTEGSPDAGIILGALSLVLWTLFIITTVKYDSFAIRENGGRVAMCYAAATSPGWPKFNRLLDHHD